MTADPVGYMSRNGVPVDHISRVLVAHALGENASPELRTLAQMGPMVSATQANSAELQALRQRLEKYDERDRQVAARSSFNALSKDKVKYPLLATALTKNPDLYKEVIDSYSGDAAALASTLEGQIKSVAEAVGYTPPVSTASTAAQQAQSTQGKQAQYGGVDPTPPPIPPATKPGLFTQEEDQALKARIVAKYS